MTISLRHSKIRLALHPLREGTGRPLLLLHALGERSPAEVPAAAAGWPGAVFALDFTGHGGSTLPAGGGYTCELLMGDADAALGHLRSATLLGRGLGAYIALLLAGARPAQVRGAILCDGAGLGGGGPEPGAEDSPLAPPAAAGPPDPFALQELSRDLRPPDYATSYAAQAARRAGLEPPLAVCAAERPPWLVAVLDTPAARALSLAEALATFAGAA